MKVAVVFGGESMERDVSVASAAEVVAALRKRGHEVLAVDAEHGLLTREHEQRVLLGRIDKKPPSRVDRAALPALLEAPDLRSVDVVFLAMHGGSGENGAMQALLDLAGLPYTGSGKLASALGMDKDVSKRLFLAAGVPTPEWCMAPADVGVVEATLGFPVVVKPNAQGSTVGLTLVAEARGLAAAIALASEFDEAVLIERYIPGRELTVGILDDAALAVGEIIPASGDIFDYEAKYQPGAAEEIFPAEVDAATAAEVQALGLQASRALRIDTYCRVDFRMDPDGGLWCLELNTLPGLTAGSLLPRSAAAAGIGFGELCERICAGALARRSLTSK